MLRGFSVENFRSFHDRQLMSFAASKIVRHKEHLTICGRRKILKSGIVFGANAGGKSNLIQSIAFSRSIIMNGLQRVNLEKCHFRIAPDAYKRPGVFDYSIMVDDTEYSYGIAVSYFKQEIIAEWLIEIEKTGEEITIFSRYLDENNVSHVESDILKKATKTDARLQTYYLDFGEDITESLRKRTMLSDIATRSSTGNGISAQIAAVYNWFESMIILSPDSKYNLINEIAVDEEKRVFFQNLLSYFDTGVESIDGQKIAMDFEEVFPEISKRKADQIKSYLSGEKGDHAVTLRIANQAVVLRKDEEGNVVYHKLVLDHGNSNDRFEYPDESDGTKRLFDLIPILFNKDRERTVLIDEIDRSLHTNLVRSFIELFFRLTGGTRAQLIMTTHDSNIMDLELFRQDEIWFVERENDHSSKIYSLNRFKERFDKIVRNDYLLGRYGAIPIFRDTLLQEYIDA